MHFQAKSVPMDHGSETDEVFAQTVFSEYHPHHVTYETKRHIVSFLELLREHYVDLKNVAGKKILVLACGSEEYYSRDYEHDPWLPRILLKLGAEPFGVDTASLEKERFAYKYADLTETSALGFLPSSRFDAFHVKSFPTIEAVRSFLSKGLTWGELSTALRVDVMRSLQPEGKILCDFLDGAEDSWLGREIAIAQAEITKNPLPKLKYK